MGREQEPAAEHHVDLGRDDLVVGELDREHHDVDDAVRRLDLRPLVALQDVLDDERMQRQGRTDLLDLVVGRVDQVDPDVGIGLTQQRRQLGQGRGAVQLARRAVDDRGHADGPRAAVGRRPPTTSGHGLAGTTGRSLRG